MIPLDLARPLAHLYDLARAEGRVSSIAALAKLHGTTPERFHGARKAGDGVRLATLAAYARAAGYVLWLGADDRGGSPWRSSVVREGLDVTVAGARALLGALGLDMTLAVEEAEG